MTLLPAPHQSTRDYLAKHPLRCQIKQPLGNVVPLDLTALSRQPWSETNGLQGDYLAKVLGVTATMTTAAAGCSGAAVTERTVTVNVSVATVGAMESI